MTYWGKVVGLWDCSRLGVTATPIRDEEEAMTEQQEQKDKSPDHLGWVIEKGGVHIGATKDPGQVLIRVVGEDDGGNMLPVEDARELLTHALVHLGGVSGRADTDVAQLAMELASLAYKQQRAAENQLADLQEKYARQSRHLGELIGKLDR